MRFCVEGWVLKVFSNKTVLNRLAIIFSNVSIFQYTMAIRAPVQGQPGGNPGTFGARFILPTLRPE
jgi:hypothetical protein